MRLFNPMLMIRLSKKIDNSMLHDIIFRINKILYGLHCHPTTTIGKGTSFIHDGQGVVVNKKTYIGENVRIFQNVTIGNDKIGNRSYPVIEDNVTIYANSVIVGGVTISEGATIAALSFVNKDVPSNEIWGGVPAKKIK